MKKRGRVSLSIPSDTAFLSNKKISDRLYVWILLNGEQVDSDIYINKTPRNAYKELGIAYRTFHKRLDNLITGGYLKNCEYRYKVAKDISLYQKYIYKDILKTLYETKIDNIIKVYVYLSSLFDMYKQEAWFTYNSILSAIGYSHERNCRNQQKIKVILEKLSELGFIKYSRKYKPGEKYQIKFQILNVRLR